MREAISFLTLEMHKAEENYQGRIFTIYSWVYFFFLALYLPLTLSQQEKTLDQIVMVLLCVLYAGYRYTRAAIVCTHLILTLTYLHVFYIALMTGGVHSSIVSWFTFLPTTALMINRRSAMVWVMLSITALTILAGLNYSIDSIQNFRFKLDDALWASLMQITITIAVAYSIWIHEILNSSRRDKLNQKTIELNLKQTELQKTQAHKDEFIASVGHELRTPMNAILGFNELLNLEARSPKAKEIIKNIEASAKQLLRVISDILDYSQLVAGKLRLLKKQQSVTQLLEQATTRARQHALGKPFEINLSMTPTTPKFCDVDPIRIAQVLDHLLNNAMKFMAAGRIEIFSSGSDDRLRIEIRDNGIGISPEKQQFIFNRFVHANTEINRRYGGTGLGLAICEQLVDLHQGRIGVNSALGRGATFWIELPLNGNSLKSTSPLNSLETEQSNNSPIRQRKAPWPIPILGSYAQSLYFKLFDHLQANAPSNVSKEKLEAFLGMVVNASFFAPVYIATSTCPELVFIHSLYPILYLITLLLMAKGSNFSFLFQWLAVMTYSYVTAAALYAGGSLGVIISWIPMISLPAFNLSGSKIGSFWLSVSLIIQAGVFYLTQNGLTPYPWAETPQPIFFYWFSYVHITLMLLYVPMHYKITNTNFQNDIELHNLSLEAAQIALIEEQKQKDDFISTVSHEFRTPMNAIIGFNHLLADEIQNQPHALELQTHVTQSAEHLLTVIDDILDYSQLQSGNLSIRNETFNLPKTLQNIQNIFQSKFTNNAVQFRIISCNIPEWTNGDKHRLTQILINLVGNAMKFTERGFVELRVNVFNNGISFDIEDSGIGISSEKIELIFNQYERVYQENSLSYAGHGLGLTICKRLVELQNGTIHAQSTLGVGSTFSVWLPFISCDTPDEQKHSSINFVDVAEQLNILVVDDHPLNRLLASEMLQKTWPKANIQEAENGLIALQKLKITSYDIIIMDMVMPEMDGIEATKIIRKSFEEPTNHTPIIGLTANINPIEKDNCLQAGMDEIIYKPFQMNDLIKTIHDLKHSKHQLQECLV